MPLVRVVVVRWSGGELAAPLNRALSTKAEAKLLFAEQHWRVTDPPRLRPTATEVAAVHDAIPRLALQKEVRALSLPMAAADDSFSVRAPVFQRRESRPISDRQRSA